MTDTVRVLSDGTDARYGGVRTCGSRLCPVCGPRIATANGQDIEHCIRQWREAEGGRVLFGTFTVRHSKTDRFDCLADGVSAGWHAVTSGRGWLRDRRRAGIVHFIRVFEEKYSMQNGWHLHVHYLMFLSRDPKDAKVRRARDVEIDLLLESMFGRWSRAVTDMGLRAPLPQGQDLHEVFGDGAESLGLYFSKQVSEAENRMTDADYKRLGFELTAKDGKTRRAGMGAVSLTPGEIMDLALLGDEFFLFLWREYEVGMNGRRVIGWSKGLRQWAGVGMESDEEIAQKSADEERSETVCEIEMRPSAFAKVVKLGVRVEVLRRVITDGAEKTVEWLDTLGVSATTGRLGVDYLDEVEADYAHSHADQRWLHKSTVIDGQFVTRSYRPADYDGPLPF